MKQYRNFYNVNELSKGIKRQLGKGLETTIFCGDRAMISIVEIQPNCKGQIHSHPQEQWGYMIEGSGVRIQGNERIEIKKGDFWLTPGGVQHGIEAGSSGAKIMDIFCPPREEYTKSGSGFGV